MVRNSTHQTASERDGSTGVPPLALGVLRWVSNGGFFSDSASNSRAVTDTTHWLFAPYIGDTNVPELAAGHTICEKSSLLFTTTSVALKARLVRNCMLASMHRTMFRESITVLDKGETKYC